MDKREAKVPKIYDSSWGYQQPGLLWLDARKEFASGGELKYLSASTNTTNSKFNVLLT